MVAAAVVGSAVVGGAMSNSASKSAAKTQAGAADRASDKEMEMLNLSREDQAPWRQVGGNALNELAMRMGIGGSTPGGGANSAPMLTREQLRAELLPQYTRQQGFNFPVPFPSDQEFGGGAERYAYRRERGPSIDEAGLNAAIEARLAQQAAEAQRLQQSQQDARNNPLFGSLARNFTLDDLKNDPVYQTGLQFGLDQGVQGLNRLAAATGSLNSGKQLKALTRFGNDYGSTKANDAFNRFNTNQSNQFNRFASLAGVGQTAAAQTGNQAIQTGQSIGNNIIGAGNARGASSIAGANAISNSIGQGINAFQSNQLMNNMFPQTYGVPQQPGVTGWVSQG